MYGGPIWAPYRHSPAYFVHGPASEMIAWLIDAGTRQFLADTLQKQFKMQKTFFKFYIDGIRIS
jgi:hypothetical protein